MANLCIRVGAEVRDGFVLARQSEAAIAAFAREISRTTGCEWTEVPLEEAAALVIAAALRGESVRPLSVPAVPAVALFRRAYDRSAVPC
jgi:hypothetical protein